MSIKFGFNKGFCWEPDTTAEETTVVHTTKDSEYNGQLGGINDSLSMVSSLYGILY